MKASSTRVLVRTYPPSSNPNYGGILQAWALRSVLTDLGLEVLVDQTRSSEPTAIRKTVAHLKSLAVSSAATLGVDAGRYAQQWLKRQAGAPILEFARKQIPEIPLYCGRRRIRRKVAAWPDVFVAGSDQVWNPKYVDVASYLFDFLGPDDHRPRIAYAASFGSDNPPFDEMLTARTAVLAKRFTAVSVREESGVNLCQQLWGVRAVRVIDPTMLLAPQDYRALWSPDERSVGGGLAVYLLDSEPVKQAIVAAMAKAAGHVRHELFAPPPPNLAAWRGNPAHYRKPTVTRWLAMIAGSDCVVTDSYHGTVFSILFNRPFLVFPNASRGAARFETLLRLFGLEDRVARHDGKDVERMSSPINWRSVNLKIEEERSRGLDFLRTALRIGDKDLPL